MKKIPLDILNPNVTIVVTILVYGDPSSEEMSNTPVLNVSTDFLFCSKRFIFLVHSFIYLFTLYFLTCFSSGNNSFSTSGDCLFYLTMHFMSRYNKNTRKILHRYFLCSLSRHCCQYHYNPSNVVQF